MTTLAIPLPPPAARRIVAVLTAREASSRLASVWFWLVATATSLIAFAWGAGFQQAFVTESVLVTADPLMPLTILVVAFLGLVLGLRLATALSGEREHRTLDVLLAGPVTWPSLVVAKLLAEVVVLAGLVGLLMAYLLLAQPLGAGMLTVSDLRSLALAPLAALPLMAAGLAVSAWLSTVRGAVIAYLACIVLSAAFEAGLGVLQRANPAEMGLSALYARAALETVSPVVALLSPIRPIAEMIRLADAQEMPSAALWWQALGLAAGYLALALVAARIRGGRS
ncbi:ABC transporter permease subunit [Ensifer soli]|uniref:ABC transporter permease subunit n=1 Tax=Ciceribacter sp. sgz301302 TaxID=3342379 RepID=UPI0035BB6C10